MATRPLEREILRVVDGPPSILFRRNNVQWTEDGDDLPHFSLKVLLNRKSVWLNARQAFLRPHAGIVAEASYFAGYCRGARKLFVYATDRPRGDRSTVKLKVSHVLVQAQGTCAAFEGRTADLVRRANKMFEDRRALIEASIVEPRERD